jgi:ferredoxin-type protein NapH
VDTGDPALPVAGTGSLSHVRRSGRARWRAGVLIGVHVLILAHITHFLVKGETLTPIEPSEAMYTLELGQLNAGFVFFVLALLSTLFFGRFFCGWACHIVALQDLCGWIMKKLGVRPRPFNSRLLLYMPLVLALYMFVWPAVKRMLLGLPGPRSFTNHLMTAGFWDTFPGPLFTVLTFASCGFAAVYLLGAKGFCSYGCPYGGFFGVVDQLSIGKIQVNDDCEQCGHCTATCTSNVRVHEEVRLYGMVVNPGCMKCMDCISVCPKNALSFGFGKPSIRKRPPSGKASRFSTLRPREELFLGVIWIAGTFFVFRGLYDGPPLLMSAGVAAMTAYLALKLWHLAVKPTVRIQNIPAKLGGKLGSGGKLFTLIAAAWMVFTLHSGFVQWHREFGRRHLNATEASQADVYSGEFQVRQYSAGHDEHARKAYRHFRLADRFGLFGVVEVKLGLAWSHLLRSEKDAAVERVREAVAMAPSNPQLHQNLVDVLLSSGLLPEATAAMRDKIAAAQPAAEDHYRLAGLLVAAGDHEGALDEYRSSLELRPDVAETRYNFGGLLRRLNRPGEAIEQLEQARVLAPEDPDTRVELGLAYAAVGDAAAAIESLRTAIDLAPESPESQYHLPGLIEELEGMLESPAE